MKQPIPNAALDDRLGFVGTAGSGKTYGAGTAVERLLQKNARVVIPDPLGVWYGLRLLADSKTPSPYDVVIFGGPNGDLPLTEHAGTLIGETVAGMKESCILDLSEIGTKAAERRFMLAFLSALYAKATRDPLHLIFDEADMWAPQKVLDKEGEANKLLGMMETVVRRGRVRGFIPWLISQRPAVISKNVLSQIDGLIAFKLTSSQDRKAIGDWVEGQADKGQWDAIWANLPTMERGNAVVWLPARGVLDTCAFPEKHTFDSSRTPKRGERPARAAELKPLNIDALKTRLSKVEAESKANDPKALRGEVARLKSELQKASKNITQNITDSEAIEAAEKRGFDQAVKKMAEVAERESKGKLLEELYPLETAIAGIIREAKKSSLEIAQKVSFAPMRRPAIQRPVATAARPAPRTNGHAPDSELPKGEKLCLAAMAQYAEGVTRQQLTVVTGYKRSTRDAYIQRLRERGYADIAGERVTATDAGIAALGSDYEPLPTGEALRDHVLPRLPDGERRVLELLIEQYPEQVEREHIDEATGFQRSTRDAYLMRLKARELVEVCGRGAVKAADELFG